jgi:hypothetical protein
LVAAAATGAGAQNPPEIEVTPVLTEKRPHMLPAQVAEADCYTGALPGSQREEVASVKVTVWGPWERSARHVASEKAAELGANCLLLVSSYGTDNEDYPVQRSYKAFRVTVPYGPWRVPASPESLASAASASVGLDSPFPKLKTPAAGKKASVHGDHLSRAMGGSVYAHEIVLDPSHAEPENWADVVQDVREYFGEPEALELSRLAAEGKTVRIDLQAGTVSGERMGSR